MPESIPCLLDTPRLLKVARKEEDNNASICLVLKKTAMGQVWDGKIACTTPESKGQLTNSDTIATSTSTFPSVDIQSWKDSLPIISRTHAAKMRSFYVHHTDMVMALGFYKSLKDTIIVSGGKDKLVCVWGYSDARNCFSRLSGHTDEIHSLCVIPWIKGITHGITFNGETYLISTRFFFKIFIASQYMLLMIPN
jgi:WD40 repeat protein